MPEVTHRNISEIRTKDQTFWVHLIFFFFPLSCLPPSPHNPGRISLKFISTQASFLHPTLLLTPIPILGKSNSLELKLGRGVRKKNFVGATPRACHPCEFNIILFSGELCPCHLGGVVVGVGRPGKVELFLGFWERGELLGSFLKGPPLISGRCCQPWLGAWILLL